jgi:Methylene-tetrahydrofolate reductase C terminal
MTKQKGLEELEGLLKDFDRVFIAGCGTCTTATKTGGIDQVLEMKAHLEETGKWVSGWTVIPVACDEMTAVSMKEHGKAIQDAGCILAMTCALGVHRMNLYLDRPVLPALDTLFIGVEETPGVFYEACGQCGHCVLGETAGICPVVACHKGLLNGPCGGTNDGKCEVDVNSDCAWTLIYDRLKAQGRLPLMRAYQPPANYQVMPRPRAKRMA